MSTPNNNKSEMSSTRKINFSNNDPTNKLELALGNEDSRNCNNKISDTQNDLASVEDGTELELLNLILKIAFIRKVYFFVIMQMSFTILINILTFLQSIRDFLDSHMWLLYASGAIVLVILIPLTCATIVGKKRIVSVVLYILFTLAVSICLCFLSAKYKPEYVILAWSGTLTMTIAVLGYGLYSKKEFNFLGAFVFVAIFLIAYFSIAAGIMRQGYQILGLATLGSVIFAVFLIIDTKLILGKFAFRFTVNDAIFASMCLYTDIVMIFVYLLSGGKSR